MTALLKENLMGCLFAIILLVLAANILFVSKRLDFYEEIRTPQREFVRLKIDNPFLVSLYLIFLLHFDVCLVITWYLCERSLFDKWGLFNSPPFY